MLLKELSEYYKKSILIFPDLEGLYISTNSNREFLVQLSSLSKDVLEVAKVRGAVPKKPPRWEDSQFVEYVSELRIYRQRIHRNFLSEESVFRVYLPDEQIAALKTAINSDMLHAHIFLDAWKSTKAALEMVQFKIFLKKANARTLAVSDLKIPKITIHQVVSNNLVHPFTYQDYHEYLKISKAEENLEFLGLINEYLQESFRFFPSALYPTMNSPHSPVDLYKIRPAATDVDSKSVAHPTKPASMSDAKFKEAISKLKVKLSFIIDTHVKSNASREVNLPNVIKKPLIDAYMNGDLHGDILMHSYEHIAEMLFINGFNKFLQEQVSNSKISTIMEDAGPQITLHQLLCNQSERPYSQADFRKFLQETSQERNLDLLMDISELEEIFKSSDHFRTLYKLGPIGSRQSSKGSQQSVVPISPTFTSDSRTIVKPRVIREESSNIASDDLAAIKVKVNQIIQEYIEPNNPEISEMLRKTLLDLNDQSIHPTMFDDLYEFIFHLTEKLFHDFLSKTHEERLACGLLSKFKSGYKSQVDKILLDQLPYPFLYPDFQEFCRVAGNLKEVEFARNVMQYSKKAAPLYVKEPKVFGQSTLQRLTKKISSDRDSTRSNAGTGNSRLSEAERPKDLSMEDFEELSKELEAEFKMIFEKYISKPGSKDYIILPPSIREALIIGWKSKILNPDIFTRSYDCIATILQKTLWMPYSSSRQTLSNSTNVSDEGNLS